MEELAATAKWTAAARARESARVDRLFNDPFASTLAGPEGRALLRRMESTSRMDEENPYLALRTRFFDSVIEDHVAAAKPAQVVLVGAGFDTRAYRCSWSAGTVLYELDQSLYLEDKHRLLAARGATSICEIRTVRIDVNGTGWAHNLRDVGFDPSTPTLWLVEGLLVYLEDASVRNLIEQITLSSSAGSRLVTDSLSSAFYRQPWAQAQLQLLRELGCPWRSSIDDPETFLAGYGWSATVTSPGENRTTERRWPFALPAGPVGDQARLFLIDACLPGCSSAST